MEKKINLDFSPQAKLLIQNCNIDEKEILDWFINERKIFVGGGDVVSFLEYKKSKGD
jgi:hypothetical protein